MCRLAVNAAHFPILVRLADPKSTLDKEVVFKRPEEIPLGACFFVLKTCYEGADYGKGL